MNLSKSKIVERVIKGAANHWRIRIMDLLQESPELSVGEVAERLKGDYRTVSDHIRKLAQSGLIVKRYEGSFVRHSLTNLGKSILEFCKKLVWGEA